MTEIVTPYGRYNTGGDAPRGKKVEVLSVSDADKMVEQLSEYEPDEVKWSCRPPAAADTECPEVVELGDDVSADELEPGEIAKVDMNSDSLEKWFTPDEIAQLKRADERATETKADELAEGSSLREKMEENEDRSESLKDMGRRMAETREWVDEDMADDLVDAYQDNTDSSTPTGGRNVDSETAEMAAAGFEEHAKDTGKSYWAEIAEDIRSEELSGVDSVRFDKFGEDTDITMKDSGSEKLAEIDTADEELMAEIRAVAEETSARVLKDTGKRMLAEIGRSHVRNYMA